ncbi:capsid protein [robinz virus RP_199]|nr:capsid protein [robinz virus RP_199]
MRRSTRSRRTTRRPRRSFRPSLKRRKRFVRKPRMTRKSILNITSRKKQDNMVSTTAANNGGSPTPSAATVAGNVGATYIWRCTARDRTDITSTADFNSVANRNNDTVFMRGLREDCLVTTNNGTMWNWRRIVFRAKGLQDWFSAEAGITVLTELETSNGWSRLLTNNRGTPLGTALLTLIFRGQSGVDWLDGHTAKLDTSRITVMFDKTMYVRSGNTSAAQIHRKFWHRMNKSFVYESDEVGSGETSRVGHALGKFGMGDVYVIDLFDATIPTSDNLLLYQPQATLYWHER